MDKLIIKHYQQAVSVNSMTFISRGRKVNTHATNTFNKYAEQEILEYIYNKINNREIDREELIIFLKSLYEQPISISFIFYRAWRNKGDGRIKKADVSNLLKNNEDIIFKSLNSWLAENTEEKNNNSLILDDKQVYLITARKEDIRPENKEKTENKPMVEVIIEKYTPYPLT